MIISKKKIHLNLQINFLLINLLIGISFRYQCKNHNHILIEIVNSNEFATRLLLDKTNNPNVEYTHLGNKDVFIKFYC